MTTTRCAYAGCPLPSTHDASAAPGRGPLALCDRHYHEFAMNWEGYLIGQQAKFEDLWLRLKGKEGIIDKRRRDEAAKAHGDDGNGN